MNIQETASAITERPAAAAPARRGSDAPRSTLYDALQRYVPLLTWFITVSTLLLIAFRIFSYGYLPAGDARRHIAKAMTDRTYPEILVLRPGYFMSNSPGWEWFLRQLHRNAGWSQDALASFSIVGLLLWIFFSPLPWLRRPEAWLTALLVQMLAIPEFMPNRLTQARPYLLTEGVLIAILFAWSRLNPKSEPRNPKEDRMPKSEFGLRISGLLRISDFGFRISPRPSWPKIILTWLGFSLCVWMHGLWYMWVLPLVAFCLAGCWRSALWLTACWLAGTFTGAALTGHPFGFLKQALFIASSISHQDVQQWMLVGELRPNFGDFSTLLLLAIVFLWRKLRPSVGSRFSSRPALWLFALGWILGLKADRFWADWGIPAVLVWLTIQFEEMAVSFWDSRALRRVAACGFIAIAVFLDASNDPDERFTFNLREATLDASDRALQGWLPEPGGIFYNTFYKNPQAPWRYVLGLEPALMPDDDLKILRRIEFNHGAAKAYEPWIAKMRPADRLAIYSAFKPALPQLEWTNAVGETWLGKLPSQKAK